MNYRTLGKTGWNISEVSLGTWQVGGKWGSTFDDQLAERIVLKAIDEGVNFIDTADVYSNGLSEKAVAKAVKMRPNQVYIATKCGRQLNPHIATGYNKTNITAFVDASLSNMDLDVLDLIQLHCPPSEVYDRDEAFDTLEELKAVGKIRHYGVSVEKVDEAMKAIQRPGVATVQIIFNMMRMKPVEVFFEAAKAADVGILARVPLASGLLTGKFNANTQFGKDDHRSFNREGAAFDKGETFSGVNYDLALQAVEEYKRIYGHENLTQYALKWILMFDAVSCVIPGASSVEQVISNVQASQLPEISDAALQEVKEVYDKYLRKEVHGLW